MNKQSKEVIELGTRVEALKLSNRELTDAIFETIDLMDLDLRKAKLLLVGPHKQIASMDTMDHIELAMTRLGAMFAAYREKHYFLLRNRPLDTMQSTIADLKEVGEHDPGQFD